MAKDGVGLRRFADFLKQCHTAMDSMKCLNILDDERENRKMLLNGLSIDGTGKLPRGEKRKRNSLLSKNSCNL